MSEKVEVELGENAEAIEVEDKLMDMTIILESMEKERDFYFTKLRDVEILCQDAEGGEYQPLVQKITDILYAGKDGFAPPDELSPPLSPRSEQEDQLSLYKNIMDILNVTKDGFVLLNKMSSSNKDHLLLLYTKFLDIFNEFKDELPPSIDLISASEKE